MIDFKELYVDDIRGEEKREDIERFLAGRFRAPVPTDIHDALQKVEDLAKLRELIDWAAVCPDMDSFRTRLFNQAIPGST